MSSFISFDELKERVKLGDVIPMLGVAVKQHGNQWRSVCPKCGGGDRTLVVTDPKGFFCFASKKGGDVISLIAHVRGIGVREAAQEIQRFLGKGTSTGTTVPGTVPPSEAGQERSNPAPRVLTPLAYLETDHPSLEALGIAPDTAKAFGAGYAGKGIMRGRFAAPIFTLKGELVAYVGIAVTEAQQPRLLFPNGFEFRGFIFNQHAVKPEDIVYVAKDPLEVLKAYDNGVQNCVSFFGEITADALSALAMLLDEKHIPAAEFI